MSLNLRKTVFTILKQHPQKQFTARELAILVFNNNREASEKKKLASVRLMNDDDVISQIAAEIGATRPIMQKNIQKLKQRKGALKSISFRKNLMRMKLMMLSTKLKIINLLN